MRVVSVNLCTDQLLVLLAEPEQIAAVSFLAADPQLSGVADRVSGLRVTSGGAEEVVALEPDLILAGRYAAQATVRLLRARGLPVVELDLAEDWDDIRAATRMVAAALGRDAEGERLLAEMDQALAAASPGAGAERPSALIYQADGFVAGRYTLADAVLAAAGMSNLAAEYGIDGYGYLGLEAVVAGRPDLLVLDPGPADRPSLAHQLMQHRALAALDPAIGAIPDWALACGSPLSTAAVTALAEARARLR